MQKKFNIMSKVWLNWGLRFPSAPTFRGGLAVIAAAMSMDLNPQHAHALFQEFQTEFRKLRGVYHGEASLKTFPSDPNEFMKMYPSLLSNVVACRVDLGSVREMSNKNSIPCRGNNATITPRTSTSATSSIVETPREQMLRGLLEVAMGSGSRAPASTPTRDSSGRRTQAAAMPPVLADAGAEDQPLHAIEDTAVVPAAAAAMIPNAANAAPGHGQPSETANDPTLDVEPSETNRSRIDKLASLAGDFIRMKKMLQIRRRLAKRRITPRSLMGVMRKMMKMMKNMKKMPNMMKQKGPMHRNEFGDQLQLSQARRRNDQQQRRNDQQHQHPHQLVCRRSI